MKPLVWVVASRPAGITSRLDAHTLVDRLRADGLVIPIWPDLAPRWPLDAVDGGETARELLARCDAVLIVAPVLPDRRHEIETARDLGLPIFDRRVTLEQWATHLDGGPPARRPATLLTAVAELLAAVRLDRPHITTPGAGKVRAARRLLDDAAAVMEDR